MNPIYKAGHKYIDLSRITAIEPVYSADIYTQWPNPEPNPNLINYVEVHCQLHENPIQITFPWDHTKNQKSPADQYQDFFNAWQAWINQNPTAPIRN